MTQLEACFKQPAGRCSWIGFQVLDPLEECASASRPGRTRLSFAMPPEDDLEIGFTPLIAAMTLYAVAAFQTLIEFGERHRLRYRDRHSAAHFSGLFFAHRADCCPALPSGRRRDGSARHIRRPSGLRSRTSFTCSLVITRPSSTSRPDATRSSCRRVNHGNDDRDLRTSAVRRSRFPSPPLGRGWIARSGGEARAG